MAFVADDDGNGHSTRLETHYLRIDTEWADGREETRAITFSLGSPDQMRDLCAFAKQILKITEEAQAKFPAWVRR
jgi:hypothetical protein